MESIAFHSNRDSCGQQFVSEQMIMTFVQFVWLEFVESDKTVTH